jgi:hypothetical protein
MTADVGTMGEGPSARVPQTQPFLLRAAHINNVCFGVLLTLALVGQTHRFFPNEYEVPDGQVLFWYLGPITFLVSLILTAVSLAQLWSAPRSAVARRTAVTAPVPLLLPGLLAVFVWWWK